MNNKMIKLYFFRHGESRWNANKDFKYSKENHNTHLTELGIKQAILNAEFLKDKNIEHIYSSPLIRAKETATILSHKINVGITFEDDLKEFSLYNQNCYGINRDEIKEKIGIEIYNKIRFSDNEYLDFRALEGCETKREARNRFVDTIKKICLNTPYKIIAISSHGAIIKEMLRYFNYKDTEDLENCEIVEVDYNNNNFNIIRRIKNNILVTEND